MRKNILILILLILSVYLLGCSNNSTNAIEENLKSINTNEIPPKIKPITDEVSEMNEHNVFNDYALNIASKLFDSKENEVFSPISLYFPLTVVYDASTEQTKQKTGEFLGLKEKTIDYYNTLYNDCVYKNEQSYALYNNIILGNSEKKQYEIMPEFINNISKYYKGYIGNLDLENKNIQTQLSDFISKNTDGAFKPKFNFDKNTILIIINTAVFKDRWLSKMYLKKDGMQFQDLSKNTKIIDSINSSKKYNYESNPDYDSVKIHLENGYYIVLSKPKNEKYQNFSDKNILAQLIQTPTKTDAQVLLSIPKFSIKSTFDMQEKLKEMGYDDIINSKNSYPNMFDGDANISSIIQEAKFDLDENGIEAAAYTMVEKNTSSAPIDKVINISFDSPFVFALKSPSGIISFIGVYKK